MINSSSIIQDEIFSYLIRNSKLTIYFNQKKSSITFPSSSICKIFQMVDMVSDAELKSFINFKIIHITLLNRLIMDKIKYVYMTFRNSDTEVKLRKKQFEKIASLQGEYAIRLSNFINISIYDTSDSSSYCVSSRNLTGSNYFTHEMEKRNKGTKIGNQLIEVLDTNNKVHLVYIEDMKFWSKVFKNCDTNKYNFKLFDSTNRLFTLNKNSIPNQLSPETKDRIRRYVIMVAKIKLVSK